MRIKSGCFSFLVVAMFAVMPAFSQNVNLAVLELMPKGMDTVEASILTDRLRSEIVTMGSYNVFEREKMDAILKEQGFQQTGCVSNECMVEMGQLIGVEQMIGGSVAKFGDMFSISLRIIDVRSGKILATAVYDHKGAMEELLSVGIKKAAVDLVEKQIKPSTTTNTVQPEPVVEKQVDNQKTQESKVSLVVEGAYRLGNEYAKIASAQSTSNSYSALSGTHHIGASKGGQFFLGMLIQHHVFGFTTSFGNTSEYNSGQQYEHITIKRSVLGIGLQWYYERLALFHNLILLTPGMNLGYWKIDDKLGGYYNASSASATNRIGFDFFAPSIRISVGKDPFYFFAKYEPQLVVFGQDPELSKSGMDLVKLNGYQASSLANFLFGIQYKLELTKTAPNK